jgi:hypothetical protein
MTHSWGGFIRGFKFSLGFEGGERFGGNVENRLVVVVTQLAGGRKPLR